MSDSADNVSANAPTKSPPLNSWKLKKSGADAAHNRSVFMVLHLRTDLWDDQTGSPNRCVDGCPDSACRLPPRNSKEQFSPISTFSFGRGTSQGS